jgi:flagellar biosynthesis protein FlhG
LPAIPQGSVMTRIMTITSGLAQTGKTQLAINLALELVRRGRLVGVFQDDLQSKTLADLLDLPPSALLLRRAEDGESHGVTRRGYQGVDFLSCQLSLRQWSAAEAGQRSRCMKNIDVPEGYDDFLIDTSLMDARSQLLCCKASAVVIIVVSLDHHSQAEAFALMQVLHLNGFSGELCFVVNNITYPADSDYVYSSISRLLKTHLGMDSSLLGGIPYDRHVTIAQRNRQAFAALFPDSGAASAVVFVADALDDIPARFVASPQTLPAFLSALVDWVAVPICLPGGAVLEDEDTVVRQDEVAFEAAGREQAGELSLLHFAGDVPGLWAFLETLPLTLQSLSSGLDDLVAVANRYNAFMQDDGCAGLQKNQLMPLLASLLEALRLAAPDCEVEFEVTDTRVTGQQRCWLQPGRYLKYVFRLPQQPLPDTVVALLRKVPTMSSSAGAEGEEICEVLAAAKNSCLSVICSEQARPRIQVWLPVVQHGSQAGVAGSGEQPH